MTLLGALILQLTTRRQKQMKIKQEIYNTLNVITIEYTIETIQTRIQ